tara:strand:- start:1814 stop:2002 length:189 start_codon:yes stop_codon:yes gene_type:complete
MATIIERCRKQLLTFHLDIYSDAVVTPKGETIFFNATLHEEKGKLPIVMLSFSDESEWLKED